MSKSEAGDPLGPERFTPVPDPRQKAAMKKDVAEYLTIHQSDYGPFKKSYLKIRHFLGWTAKLLVPDFLIGHPNLWDNIKTLHKHPHFKPFRMAVIAWVIVMLTIGSTGFYALTNSSETRAANDFSIKTGYYFGDGVTLSVTGIGFTPQVVIIKAETAAGAMVWKSSAMPAAVTAYLGVATADNTETEITLNADGFTISPALEVNTLNVRYAYIAFAGSDCSSGGALCVGAYTGNGTSPQAITTGFQPNLVWVKRTTALAGTFRTSSMTDNHGGLFSAAVNDTSGIYFTTLNSSGFSVGATNNTNSGIYYYVAFKNVTNKLTVGQFTGDGVDNRDIGGLGFEPDFVFVKQNAATAPVINTTEMYGDLSAFSTATASAINHVQSLDADGFQVGTSTNVNASGVVSNYFVFGGVADPAGAGSFFMQRGSYTGTGIAQSIETSFQPDLVFIKGDTTEYAMWTTSMDYNTTYYFALSSAAIANAITDTTTTGFTVGTSNTVNASGVAYEWVAYGNATSPRNGTGAADFSIGTYSGNGLSPRVIDHLGFAPDMVTIKRAGAATLPIWGSSSMAANTSGYFSATANVTDGTTIRSLDSGGFTVGTGATANTVNGPYVWFAFKQGANFDVGSYAGDSVADREITGVGFQSDFLWTKRDTAIAAVHRSSSSTIPSGTSQHFLNLADDTNDIKTFTADGFTLGNSAEVNTTGGTYQYAAWNSSTSVSAPSTPTNSAPANGATAQSLNTTLTGSAYSDPDSNVQTDAQWQVDDDSDFATPVWSRISGSAQITTSITAANGTFANELAGKTELDHNTLYHWRVRYSDGVWSSWSTGTSYTTNIITTPINSSPADQATVTTLTPTLTASAFADAQAGHTATSAQWQINTSNGFTSPLYDSGTVAYGASLVVPAATLSANSVYYWRVRYADQNAQWSAYSTATRFLISQPATVMTVKALFGSTVVDQGDAVNIDAQTLASDGSPINDATVTVTIYNPSGTKIVTAAAMTYLTASNGSYRYAYTIPSTSGSYLYEVTAVSGSTTSYGASNFEVRTIASNVGSIKTTVESEQTAQTAERAAQAAERVTQGAFRTDTTSRLTTIGTNVSTVITTLNTVNTNLSSVLSTVNSIRATQLADTNAAEIAVLKQKMDAAAAQLALTLAALGTLDVNMATLLQVSPLDTAKLLDIQNKIADLQAVSAVTRRVVEQSTVEPLVETYFKFNSVEIHFLISNPLSSQQTVIFKEFLPVEVKPEHILDKSGLKIDYDSNAGVYYASGEITLGAKESVLRKVEMKDIWVYAKEEIDTLKKQAEELLPPLSKTQYESQGAILKNEIDSVLSIVLLKQEAGYSSPNDHIVANRENKEQMKRVESNLAKLRELVVTAGASSGLVGQLGGIQAFATWGIILAIVLGFGLLAALMFAMWRHQIALAADLLKEQKNLVPALAGGVTLQSNQAPVSAAPPVTAVPAQLVVTPPPTVQPTVASEPAPTPVSTPETVSKEKIVAPPVAPTTVKPKSVANKSATSLEISDTTWLESQPEGKANPDSKEGDATAKG